MRLVDDTLEITKQYNTAFLFLFLKHIVHLQQQGHDEKKKLIFISFKLTMLKNYMHLITLEFKNYNCFRSLSFKKPVLIYHNSVDPSLSVYLASGLKNVSDGMYFQCSPVDNIRFAV